MILILTLCGIVQELSNEPSFVWSLELDGFCMHHMVRPSFQLCDNGPSNLGSSFSPAQFLASYLFPFPSFAFHHLCRVVSFFPSRTHTCSHRFQICIPFLCNRLGLIESQLPRWCHQHGGTAKKAIIDGERCTLFKIYMLKRKRDSGKIESMRTIKNHLARNGKRQAD